MAALPAARHCSHLRVEKSYTSFKWPIEDWSLVGGYYLERNFESIEFPLSNGITCKLKLLRMQRYEPYYVDDDYDIPEEDFVLDTDPSKLADLIIRVTYKVPESTNVFISKISLSLIDEDAKKLLTTELIDNEGISAREQDINLPFKGHDIEWYLRSDTLTIFCEITIVDKIYQTIDFENVNFSSEIREKFRKIMYGPKPIPAYDAKFIVEGQVFWAHKSVLAEQSHVFQDMFTMDVVEKKTGAVHIQSTKADVFKAFLEYMYAGRVRGTESVVEGLCVLGDKYEVEGLKTFCKLILSLTNSKKP